jgi:hypothetical protein
MIVGFFLLMLVAACTSRPSVQEVLDQSTPPICEKSKECAGAAFAVAYPGGVDECVSKTKAEASKKYGGDLDKSSVCSDEELDKCLKDFKAAACPATGLPKIPCDC